MSGSCFRPASIYNKKATSLHCYLSPLSGSCFRPESIYNKKATSLHCYLSPLSDTQAMTCQHNALHTRRAFTVASTGRQTEQ